MILCAYGIVGAYLISSLFGNTMYYTTPFFMMLLGMSGALIRVEETPCPERKDPSRHDRRLQRFCS